MKSHMLWVHALMPVFFDNGCGFGGGNPHEVKPFPKGHGAAHGADEAHNIYVLFDAIKMLILGIKAIDDKWS